MDKLETVIKNDLSWLQRHERMVLVILTLAAVLWLGNKWLDKSATDAERKAAVAEQVLAETKQSNEKLAAQLATQSANFEQERLAREQEIKTLLSAIASRDAASAKKIIEVKAPKEPVQVLKDLNDAYAGTLPVLPNAVTSDGMIQFPAPVVQEFTVTKIERDTAVADSADRKEAMDKQQLELLSVNNLIDTYDRRVVGLETQITQTQTKCEADLAVIKAQARKSKRNWFIAGFVAGIATRILVKF